jgi:hypothetical protein
MATFTEARVRARARQSTTLFKTARMLVEASTQEFASHKNYDVFLSHSIADAEIILGVKLLLEDKGLKVYVDWIEDSKLDRSKVNAATAEILRHRMRSCKSLIYVHSTNSGQSKWMPWELGFFDGHNGAVAMLPVTQSEQNDFDGQEYLGLYPNVEEGIISFSSAAKSLKVRSSATQTRDWSTWVARPRDFAKTR